ncbi:MAG: calcium/sodium antiporter [Thermomicrobiales bacterium]
MNMVTIVLFAAGLVLLIAGAELLVRGASSIATLLGISPLVIGLTVVAIGTSAPELAVSIQSSFAGKPDLAVGNVVGSNIFNLLFILGVTALVAPLVVSQQLVRLDVPIMIGATALLLGMALDGRIGRLDGALLVVGFLAYTGFLIRQSRNESAAIRAEYDEAFGTGNKPRLGRGGVVIQLALVAVGLVMLVLGADWLVNGAVAMATALGVSELVIGLTIVAVGTSLPEIATSIMATVRGERDIAVGNVVGSCIFNILAVVGISSVVSPAGLPVAHGMVTFDIPAALLAAFACLPIFLSGRLVSRWQGAMLFGWYIAYTGFLVLNASSNGALPTYKSIVLLVLLPLTALILMVALTKELRASRKEANRRSN